MPLSDAELLHKAIDDLDKAYKEAYNKKLLVCYIRDTLRITNTKDVISLLEETVSLLGETVQRLKQE